MNLTEYHIHSQHGEDGIIHELLRRTRGDKRLGIGVALEIGCRADENNTLALRELGWRVVTVDARPDEADIQEWVTADDVAARAEAWGVPHDLDFLSIDIDGQDLWVMNSLLRSGFRPRVICVEYNAAWGAERAVSVPEQADWVWIPRTAWFGASLLALARCAATYGYVLVGCDSSGTNAFFVMLPQEKCDVGCEDQDMMCEGDHPVLVAPLEEQVIKLFRSATYPPFPSHDGPVVTWTS